MEISDYRARLVCFRRVFANILELEPASSGKHTNRALIAKLRDWMKPPQTSPPLRRFMGMPPTMVRSIKSIHKVLVSADLETLTKQADAVKEEIIRTVLSYQERQKIGMSRTISNHSTEYWDNMYYVKDFIRSPDGRKIMPFDYWEDCCEVYIRNKFENQSNGNISRRYTFKSSEVTETRARLGLIASMQEETELLLESVRNNSFPPKLLKRGKQPRIKLGG